ncbi:MAG: oligosaccharide flippase family protein [Bdellovibrionales bacterium]|nr:oligosaccharide flippase family protein [Bdellovibrionales bacterium]
MGNLETRVASSTLFNMFGNGVRVSLSFLQAILVAKWLGVAGYGKVNLILGYTSFLHYLFMVGFDHTLPYFLSTQQKDVSGKEMLKSSIGISLGLSLSILIVLILSLFLILPGTLCEDLLWPAIIISIQMELSALGFLIGGYFRANKCFREVIVREQILFPLASLFGMFIFIKVLGFTVLGYAWGFFLASFVALLYMLVTLKNVKEPKPGPMKTAQSQDFSHWGTRLRFSFPVGVMATLEPIFNFSAIVIAGWLVTVEEIGYLAVSVKLGFFVTLVLLALNPIFTPYFADLWQSQNLHELKKLYQRVVYWCMSWALLVSFFFAVMSRECLLLFGREYTSASPVFLAVLPGLFFEGAFGATKLSLVMAGKNYINVFNFLLAIFLNAMFIYLGHRWYGVVGVAAGFSLTMALLNLLRAFQFYWLFRIPPLSLSTLGKALASAALLSLPLFLGAAYSGLLIKLAVTLALSLVAAGMLFWSDRKILLQRMGL